MGTTKVAPAANSQTHPPISLVSDYGTALYCKSRLPRKPEKADSSVSINHGDEDGLKRLKDVGDKRTLITAAELGLVQQYRELKMAGQKVLQVDFPYHYSSILYACYGNQYKILQLVEREFCSGRAELTLMHTTRCWVGKNSAMVAAYQGHLETMLYIIDLDLQGKFGDVDLFKQRDVMGKTAMDWAASQGHTDTIEVLLLRSLYKLLPAGSTDQIVIRTRWKLVSLLAELSQHCRDYDPTSARRFFQEVLASINYNPTAAAAAAATAAVQADTAAAGDGGGSTGGGGSIRRTPLKAEAGIDDASWDDVDEQQEAACTDVRQPQGSGGAGGGEGGSRRMDGVKWADSSGEASGAPAASSITKRQHHRSDSVLLRPSGTPNDVHVTVAVLMDVVTSACRAGINCMGVIMYIQVLLQQARYFDDLVARCIAWEVQLLDTCRNKSEVQAVLTPTEQDPSEPVGYALATCDKAFLSHKYIQQVFTEKWDTMGVTDYARSLLGIVWGAAVTAVAFAFWAVLCPLVILLRAFFSPVEDFMQRGKVIVDSRFPWHVPLYRWMLSQCTLLTFVVLLSYRVFSDSSEATLSSAVSPINTLLAVWCLAMIVEEVQEFLEEGSTAYISSGWNLMDVTMSTAFLLQYLMRIGIVAAQGARNMSALLVVNDLLAAAALMAWFR
ncbi:hypothetical protein Vretifemale_6550 [Volvox reticuliferus]|nr:hypothetical protein Vretifemale_6550 [Volvox reticuliferus]